MWTSPPSVLDAAGVMFAGYRLEIHSLMGRAPVEEADPLFGNSEVLIFDYRKPRDREPKEEILDSFLGIHTPIEAEDFARVFGALGLCRHGLPFRHAFLTASGKDGRTPFKDDPDSCRPLDRVDGGKWLWTESVGAWLSWAEIARWVLKARTALSRKDANFQQLRLELAKLYQPGPPFDLYFERYPRLRRKEREKLNPSVLPALWANTWLELSGATLRCGRGPSGPRLEPCAPSSSLLGFISLQLAQVVCGAKRMVLCAVCGTPCTPKRITEGRNSYCPKHRERGRYQLSKTKTRETAKRIHELKAQGRSTGEIARELHIETARVRTVIGRN